ncbi:MAG: hypothetical protein WA747_14000 [Steroidobacteraceae bacterium]
MKLASYHHDVKEKTQAKNPEDRKNKPWAAAEFARQAAGRSEKPLRCQSACADICDTLTMHALSLYNDTAGEGDQQRTRGGGVAEQKQQFSKTTRTVQLFESVSFE